MVSSMAVLEQLKHMNSQEVDIPVNVFDILISFFYGLILLVARQNASYTTLTAHMLRKNDNRIVLKLFYGFF